MNINKKVFYDVLDVLQQRNDEKYRAITDNEKTVIKYFLCFQTILVFLYFGRVFIVEKFGITMSPFSFLFVSFLILVAYSYALFKLKESRNFYDPIKYKTDVRKKLIELKIEKQT